MMGAPMYLERKGKRVLLCGAVITIAGLLYSFRSLAQEAKLTDPKQQPGRFQIFMHPQFRADQYLVDTVTGQIWQLTKFGNLEGEPEAWKPMVKLDNDVDMRAFLLGHRSSAPAAPPKLPKALGNPQRLSPMD